MLNRTDHMNSPRGKDELERCPHNIEAEQALLGALLVSNDVFERVSDIIGHEHFYDPLHQRIYVTIARLLNDNKKVTPVTLNPYFEQEPPIGQITVAQYLGRLMSQATSVINAGDYAKTIKEHYQLRELVLLGEDIKNTALHVRADLSAVDQITDAEARLFDLVEIGSSNWEIQQEDIIRQVADEILQDADTKRRMAGLSTGFRCVDEKIGGMKAGQLIVLAGATSQGKSALALNIAANVAAGGTHVAFFSLEMSSYELALRQFSQRTRLPASVLEKETIGQQQSEEIARLAMGDLAKLPITYDQTGGLTLAQLTLRARKLARTRKTGLIVVDYLQIMRSEQRTGSTNDDITQITNGLKALAKQLKLPILVLSQLKRGLEMRKDKRPHLPDLRSSGAIEQDADVVMFVFREDYYWKQEEPDKDAPPNEKGESGQDVWNRWELQMRNIKGKAEVIVAKQRNGHTGTARMKFSGALTSFYEDAQ